MTEPFNAREQGESDGYAASENPLPSELLNRPLLFERGRREFEEHHEAHIRASQAFDLDRMKERYASSWVNGFYTAEADRANERRNHAYWARIEHVMTERNLTREEAVEADRAEFLAGLRK